MNSMKRQNDRILKEELRRSVGAQYATGDQWRNNSRKNEGMEPKQKEYPAVDVTGDRSKVRYCKEQYCIGTWNVRSMNQGKLEVVKQEMARVNVDILGISKLKWTGMGELNSDDPREEHRGFPAPPPLSPFSPPDLDRRVDCIFIDVLKLQKRLAVIPISILTTLHLVKYRQMRPLTSGTSAEGPKGRLLWEDEEGRQARCFSSGKNRHPRIPP